MNARLIAAAVALAAALALTAAASAAPAAPEARTAPVQPQPGTYSAQASEVPAVPAGSAPVPVPAPAPAPAAPAPAPPAGAPAGRRWSPQPVPELWASPPPPADSQMGRPNPFRDALMAPAGVPASAAGWPRGVGAHIEANPDRPAPIPEIPEDLSNIASAGDKAGKPFGMPPKGRISEGLGWVKWANRGIRIINAYNQQGTQAAMQTTTAELARWYVTNNLTALFAQGLVRYMGPAFGAASPYVTIPTYLLVTYATHDVNRATSRSMTLFFTPGEIADGRFLRPLADLIPNAMNRLISTDRDLHRILINRGWLRGAGAPITSGGGPAKPPSTGPVRSGGGCAAGCPTP